MYWVFLFIGAGFVIISLIFGEMFDFDGPGIIFLKPKVLALTLTVMGGVGLILSGRMNSYLVFPISLGGGMLAGFLLYRFIFVPLYRMQHTSTHDKQSLIGSFAKVVLTIPQGGYGKIKYTVSGSIVTSPAKTEDGSGIEKDTDVVIVAIKNNAYYVKARVAYEPERAAPREEVVLNAN